MTVPTLEIPGSMDAKKTVSDEVFVRALVLSIQSFIALVLNTFVGYLLYRSSKTLTPSNYIYAHLIAGDTIFSFSTVIFQLYTVITRTPWSYYMCQISGFTVQSLEGVCVLLILLQILNPLWIIALERPALTVKQIGWCIAFIWIYGGIITSCYIWMSGDEYKVMPAEMWCYINYQTPKWGTVTVLYSSLWILLTTPFQIGGSYYWMWKKMSTTGSQQKREREKKLQWIIVRKGIFLSVSFFLIWSYPASVMLWRYFSHTESGPWFDFMAAVTGLVANMSNPVILLVTDDKIREEYNEFLERWGVKKNVSHNSSRVLLIQRPVVDDARDPATLPDSAATATEVGDSKKLRARKSFDKGVQVLASLSEIASTIPETVEKAME